MKADADDQADLLFDIAGLIKRLGGADGFELQVPCLRIRRGAFVAVTGKSGSGKSTLLDVLSLIAAPDGCNSFRFAPAGAEVDLQLVWQGEAEVTLANLRRRFMGYVLQSGGLCSFLDVADNVALPLRMNRVARADAAATVRAALAMFDMADYAHRDVRSLSGGERQRVAILRAMVHRPAVVFADEPTAALDFETARRVLDGLCEAARAAGSTIVMVTHDEELVEPFADQHVIFRQASQGDNDIRRYIAEDAGMVVA